MKCGGCWIFLSHSSADIEKVRLIRNEFERHAHNPLAFHLKCLNADTPEGKLELDNLIKREIDSRQWFVFCESPSASSSDYVKMEKEYIIKQGKQNVWSINMTLPISAILKKVRDICSLIKVFISYVKSDGLELYTSLSDALLEKDFNVWGSEDLVPSIDFSRQVTDVIKDTAESGFSVILITKDFHTSPYCLEELTRILSTGTKVIPLVFGDATVPPVLSKTQCFFIPHIPTKKDFSLIVELIEAELESKIVGPIHYQADKFNKIKEIYEKLNYTNRYHTQEAICVGSTGAMDDYLEIYEFPCCGKRVVVGDGPVSRFRADGCCCDEH